MNLAEFRAQTADLPGDTEIAVWDEGTVTWYEGLLRPVLPATPIHPYAVIAIGTGIEVEVEYDLAVRTGIDYESQGDHKS